MIVKSGKGEGTLNLIAWEGYTDPKWVKPFVKQNLETSSTEVIESRGRRGRLEWRPEHTFDMERPGGHE